MSIDLKLTKRLLTVGELILHGNLVLETGV